MAELGDYIYTKFELKDSQVFQNRFGRFYSIFRYTLSKNEMSLDYGKGAEEPVQILPHSR